MGAAGGPGVIALAALGQETNLDSAVRGPQCAILAEFASFRYEPRTFGGDGLPPSDDKITRPPPGASAKIVAIYDYWRRIASRADVLPGRQHLHP
jgi:hypothetical protein